MDFDIKGFVWIGIIFVLGITFGGAAFALDGVWRVGILSFFVGFLAACAIGLYVAKRGD